MDEKESASMTSPRFSIAICTCNRAQLVHRALEGLFQQTYAKDQFEVLVLDNLSKDNTQEITENWAEKTQGQVKFISQPEIGLTKSRNKAMEIAKGDFVIYLDDDAKPSPTWLDGYAELLTNHPNCDAAGGPVILEWETHRPSWLRENEENWYTGLDLGAKEFRLQYPKFPYGANMLWRKSIIEKLGGFDPDISYDASTQALIPNDDMHLTYLLYRMGGEVWYTPKAPVHHWIAAERTTVPYFLKKAYYQGVADVKVYRALEQPNATREMGKQTLHILAFWRAKMMRRCMAFNPESLYYVLFRAKEEYNRGFLDEWRRNAPRSSTAVD